jgi:hypothetical protein
LFCCFRRRGFTASSTMSLSVASAYASRSMSCALWVSFPDLFYGPGCMCANK